MATDCRNKARYSVQRIPIDKNRNDNTMSKTKHKRFSITGFEMVFDMNIENCRSAI